MATFGAGATPTTFVPGTTLEQDQAALNAYLGGGGLNAELSKNPGISNLNDFLDTNKIMSPDQVAGLSPGTDFASIGSKFKDLGANFKNPAAASSMLSGMEVPDIPKFDAQFPSLNSMMSQHQPTLDGLMTGGETCSGALGLPAMVDFVGPVSGCPEIDAIVEQGATAETIADLNAMLDRSEALFDTAGIDLDATPATPTLGAHMRAATSLHSIGTETNGAGSEILRNMLPTGPVTIPGVGTFGGESTAFSESIKASMIEAKNNALMSANGISPPQYNPFEGLPSDPGQDNSLNSNNAQKLLGGS